MKLGIDQKYATLVSSEKSVKSAAEVRNVRKGIEGKAFEDC